MPSSSERRQSGVAALNPDNLAKHTATLSNAADPGRTVRWYLCTVEHAAHHYPAGLADPNLLESAGRGSGREPDVGARNEVAGCQLLQQPSRGDSEPLDAAHAEVLVKREASVPTARQHVPAVQAESAYARVPRSREASTSTQQPGRRNFVGMMRSRRESEQMELDKQAPALSSIPDAAAEAAPALEMEMDMTWRRKKGKKADARSTDMRDTRAHEPPQDEAVRLGVSMDAKVRKDKKPAGKPKTGRDESSKTRDEVEREELLAQRRQRRQEKAEIRNVAVKDRTKITSASFKATAAQRETAQPRRREDDRDQSRKRKRERTSKKRESRAGSVSSDHESRDVRRQQKAGRAGGAEAEASGHREGDSNGSESASEDDVQDYRIYEPPKKRRIDSVQRSIRLVAEGVQKSSKHPLARARHIAPQGRVTLKSGIYNRGAASTKTRVPSSSSKKIAPLSDLAFDETVFLKMQRKERRDRPNPDTAVHPGPYKQAQTIRSPGRPRVMDSEIAHRKNTKQATTERAPSPELAEQPPGYRKQRAVEDAGQRPAPRTEYRAKGHSRLETKEAERSSSPAPILPVHPRLLPRSNDAAERIAEPARASSESRFKDGLSDASLERRRVEARMSVPDEQANQAPEQPPLQQHQYNLQPPEKLYSVDHGPLTKAGQAFLIPVQSSARRSSAPSQRRQAGNSAHPPPGLREPQVQHAQGLRRSRSFETGLEDFGGCALADHASGDDAYELPAFADVTNGQRRDTALDETGQYAGYDGDAHHLQGHDIKRGPLLHLSNSMRDRDIASRGNEWPVQHEHYLSFSQTYACNEQIYDDQYEDRHRDCSLEYYDRLAEAASGENDPEVDYQQQKSLEEWYADLSEGWKDGDSCHDGNNAQDSSLFYAAEQHPAPQAGDFIDRQSISQYDGVNFSMLADSEGEDLALVDQYQPAEPELEFVRSQGEKLGLRVHCDHEAADRLQGQLASHWRPHFF